MKRLISIVIVMISALSFCFTGADAYTDSFSDIADPKHDFDYYGKDYISSIDSGKSYRSENAYFRDEAEVFANDFIWSQLFDDIQKTADNIGMNIAVFIGGAYRDDNTTETFASKSSEYLFGKEGDVDSVFLYLDFEGRSTSYDYIDTFHDARLYFTDSDIEDIIDDMYDYLPSSGSTVYKSDVNTAIKVFLDALESEKSYGANFEAYYYNEETKKYHYSFLGNIIESSIFPYRYFIIFLLTALVVGVICAVVSGARIRKKYKFREGESASVYTSNSRVSFRNVQDIYLGSHVTKQKIESGHGGGGGGGGGGGSHGGGGGHR